MRLLIASDIHGDGKCCEAMLSSAEKENVDKKVLRKYYTERKRDSYELSQKIIKGIISFHSE